MNSEEKTKTEKYSDEELIKQWPGFKKIHNVDGVELHYVDGCSGKPLICFPGWPQTWYSYHTKNPRTMSCELKEVRNSNG